MNKVILIGRIVKDPELRFIPGTGTATCTITLAVDKYNTKEKKMEADFINVVIWGKQAESTAQYMTKGSQMAICGRIQTRSYEANDGTKRYVTEVVASEVKFLDKKGQANNSNNGQGTNDAFNYSDYEDDLQPVNDGNMPF